MGYKLTKMDISALNKADYLSVALVGGVSRVSATKRIEKTSKNPFAIDIDHVIDAPVTARGLPTGRYYASMSWHGVNDLAHILAVIWSLRVGDEIEFLFRPDYHTNEYMRRADLHSDVLQLIVVRGKRRVVFEIAHGNCPENSARMCQNSKALESV